MLIRHFASVIHIFFAISNEIVRSNCSTERNKEIVFLSHWLLFMHSRVGLISRARTSDNRKKEKEQKCNRAPTDYGSLKWNGLIKKDTWCGRRAKHNDVVIIYNGLDISSLSVSGTQERAISFFFFSFFAFFVFAETCISICCPNLFISASNRVTKVQTSLINRRRSLSFLKLYREFYKLEKFTYRRGNEFFPNWRQVRSVDDQIIVNYTFYLIVRKFRLL